jgi:hypothetical protein
MAVERKIEIALNAAEKKMTTGELREFVRALDESGVPDNVEVKAKVTMASPGSRSSPLGPRAGSRRIAVGRLRR